ncbi:hypothetical protein M0R45_001299 [Rubus argutus]|uniref:Secreted protein n=1 Tax=Rubus argutus TaxID=59490 RepID=A0AAW1VLR7_RUBAR
MVVMRQSWALLGMATATRAREAPWLEARDSWLDGEELLGIFGGAGRLGSTVASKGNRSAWLGDVGSGLPSLHLFFFLFLPFFFLLSRRLFLLFWAGGGWDRQGEQRRREGAEQRRGDAASTSSRGQVAGGAGRDGWGRLGARRRRS